MIEKFDFEKTMQNARDFNLAVNFQEAFEIIYQRVRNEMTKIMKSPGGEKFLQKITDELEKEGIHAEFKAKVPCAKCGTIVDGDNDHFHFGDTYYCLRCGGKRFLEEMFEKEQTAQ